MRHYQRFWVLLYNSSLGTCPKNAAATSWYIFTSTCLPRTCDMITSKLQRSQQKFLSKTLGVAEQKSKMTHTGLRLQDSKSFHINPYLFFL